MEKVKQGKKVYRIPNGIANIKWGISGAGWPKKEFLPSFKIFHIYHL